MFTAIRIYTEFNRHLHFIATTKNPIISDEVYM